MAGQRGRRISRGGGVGRASGARERTARPAQGHARGLKVLPGYLDRPAQEALAAAIFDIIARAPLFVPRMPKTGKPFSVRMTNCGPLGWVSDKTEGYRYQATHPATGRPWPGLPERLLALWDEVTGQVTGLARPPEACLINYYAPGA